ncbi:MULTISPECIES: exodeoxyribonuclease V subunit alpha [unclassified Gordonia (in: high G+C Gram-positive bacteria)]|uniref:exodeoxyribonuclease V subunit alpha n=1 Tax=unclassified Gordonia (in: high G+C Gram-positive bacteria) TaxID=2657482 RepID=UPI001B83742D|nr:MULTISPECIES: exodeoxyribonuclease V subunit alpha [unclassified Gordonia (in: high G+C Gram-positive bacteria)]MBR7193305.1 exodeoxyribonuclease V subunit alpha [Gordonia sp. SCSIO 19800]MCX2754858.1 exodeoxyribonuclease V subunit alpha [Gordonia sp. 4N]MDT0222040.1 exodeoxyribonuclease V subunit alpha [Gordonia sp. AC31]
MTVSDVQVVEWATGVLAEWNAAGVLAAADVHITDRLVTMCAEPVSEIARLGAALAVRAVRLGSTCLALDRLGELAGDDTADLTIPSSDAVLDALLESPLVAGSEAGPLRPLVVRRSIDGPLVYLQKYFRQEQTIRETLARRAQTTPVVEADALRAAIAAVYTSPEDGHLQKLAAVVAATRWTTVLAGGPGTGKTYTVARILAVLDALQGPGLRIGLCAPTGRAAAQLQASVEAESTVPVTAHAVTLHSLLGWRPGANPRYGRGRTLPHDVIVVDETSMLSMTAMSRLLDAVRPDARVIFVGDPHQLASVEAGAVLADLVERADVAGVQGDLGTMTAVSQAALEAVGGDADHELEPEDTDHLAGGVITLRRQFRFGGGISRVAAAVNAGDADEVLRLVAADDVPNVELVAPDDLDAVRADLVEWGRALRAAARRADADGALDALDAHRVLCAHREGSWGVRGWSARITEWLGTAGAELAGWYAGQPILVTANDRQTATFNGDTGVVIADPEGRTQGADAVRVAFRRGGSVRLLHPTQLADVVSVHAMTIHRSQGSQFRQVTVILPPTGSELLTRELLYTAITRARDHVRIVGTPEVLAAAVDRRVQRASGLRSAVTPFDRS